MRYLFGGRTASLALIGMKIWSRSLETQVERLFIQGQRTFFLEEIDMGIGADGSYPYNMCLYDAFIGQITEEKS